MTQRRARVEIAAAVGEVVVRQQDLRGVQAELRERRLVGLHEAHLPDRGRGLQLVDRARPRASSRGACMPSAIAPDETSTTSLARALQRGDLRRPARDGGVVEPAAVVGDEARADLDDQPRARAADGARSCARRLRRCAGAARTGAGSTTIGALRRLGAACAAGCASSQSWIAKIERAAAFAVDRRRSRTPAPSSEYALTNALHARFALVLGHEVELVQHEPARLRRAALRRSASSSLTIARASRTGSASGSSGAMSTMCSSSRVRCRWRRNWWPRPAPSAAPSMRPGNVGDDEAARSRRCARRRGSARAS